MSELRINPNLANLPNVSVNGAQSRPLQQNLETKAPVNDDPDVSEIGGHSTGASLDNKLGAQANSAAANPASPQPVPFAQPSSQPISQPPVVLQASDTLQARSADAGPDLSQLLPTQDGAVGAGVNLVNPNGRSAAQRLHNFLAHRVTKPYECVVSKVLDHFSDTTTSGAGVNIEGLLNVERTLYQSLAGSKQGYTGGAAPLFQALADGQAAYVNLGQEKQNEADHLMRMFAGLPLGTIEAMGDQGGDLAKVRQTLLARAKDNQFPVYVDMDGSYDIVSPSESIASESIASIARRENNLGDQFPDPRRYYKWLVTRVESAYQQLDPWLFGICPQTHKSVEIIKEALTPPWISENSSDPFGFTPEPGKAQDSYREFYKVCGGGQPLKWDTLRTIADTSVALDRDLMSGIQTYWIKFLREVAPDQRKSLMPALAKSWVMLNTLPPDHPEFAQVSPSQAPYIKLYEKNSDRIVEERYDRAMAMSQVIDHTLDGLGIAERRDMLNTLMGDIRSQKPQLQAREQRLREAFGDSYIGLDVDAILAGKKDIHDPEVKTALSQLRDLAQPSTNELCPMTVEHAEIIRHRDLMDWVATRYSRYGDVAFDKLLKVDGVQVSSEKPLILGEFWVPTDPNGPTTPIPAAGPTKKLVLGKAVSGKDPLPASVVLEGGGGKGFAYVEAMRQVRQALNRAEGQVAIDEFVGNSAGAISAGLLAAGYTPEELGEVLKKLDFKKFYSDYLWLSGGVDPKARGIDRTGLFSMQKMYKAVSELIAAKVPVEGRPVMFADMPYKLKVTSTLLNTDMTPEERESMHIGKDGQTVFSADTTPHMDVAAAICCSAAIPGFFNSPQLQVAGEVSRDGSPVLRRMQMVDGGVVNNFPIAEAGTGSQNPCLVNIPTYYRAPSLVPGQPPVELSVLNFDSTNLAAVDAYNKEKFAKFVDPMAKTVQKLGEAGHDRVVLAFDLADETKQPAPILQGTDRKATKAILKVADSQALPHMSARDGANVIESGLQKFKTGYLEQIALNALLDREDTFSPGLFTTPEFRPSQHEANGLSDMVAGVMAAKLTSPSQLQKRLFEKD